MAANWNDPDRLADITHRLGMIGDNDFERLCSILLPKEYSDWADLKPRHNSLGKGIKGTPDAHVRLEDGNYVAFQYTTKQDYIQKKVIEDINKVADCHFGSRTVEVVVCLNTSVGDEHELYQETARTHKWLLEVFDLHKLSALLLKHLDLCDYFLRTSYNTPASSLDSVLDSVEEAHFESGYRIKTVREELGLLLGEFCEGVGYLSERALRLMEENTQECPLSLLKRVADFSGVSLEWLKHGRMDHSLRGWEKTKTERRYPFYDLTVYNVDRDLETLRSEQPQHIYFCLETRSYHVMVIIQTSEHCWKAFDLGIGLDFWTWIEDFYYIPRFRTLIKSIYDFDLTVAISSRIVPHCEFMQVMNGEIHPRKAIEASGREGRHWAEDIVDIYHEHHHAPEYEKDYGKWFPRAQEEMRKYDDYDQRSRKTEAQDFDISSIKIIQASPIDMMKWRLRSITRRLFMRES